MGNTERAVLVVGARGKAGVRERDSLMEVAKANHMTVVAVVGQGGASQAGVRAAIGMAAAGTIGSVVCSRLAILGRGCLALKVLVGFHGYGVRVIAADAPWLAFPSAPAIVQHLSGWLMVESAAPIRPPPKAYPSGSRPGRPARAIPPGALHLISKVGFARAAAVLKIGETTLRRWAKARSFTADAEQVVTDETADGSTVLDASKQHPSQAAFEGVIEKAVFGALRQIAFVQDRRTCLDTAAAIFSIGLNILLAGGGDQHLLRVQLDRALLTKLNLAAPTPLAEAQAEGRVIEPGTIGFQVLKPAAA